MDDTFRPEDLNTVDNSLKYGIRWVKRNLRRVLGIAQFDDPVWSKSLEIAYEKCIRLHNPGLPNYEKEVLRKVSKYMPVK